MPLREDRRDARVRRPPLDWEVLHTYTLPEGKGPRAAACQVAVASAGYDHRNKIDVVRFSYCLGYVENDEFRAVRHIPDDRAVEFRDVFNFAMSDAKVRHANAVKAVQGKLTANVAERFVAKHKEPK
jgi:hypothetical protein